MAAEPRLTNEQRTAVEEFRKRHRTAVLALVFTDIEGSTALKQRLGELPASALIKRHNEVIREILAGFAEAQEISTAGDSFFLVFAKPSDAVRFALLAQVRLRSLAEFVQTDFRVRTGIHLGEVAIEEQAEGGPAQDVLGMQVDLAARVTALAVGGQILMTRGVFDNARQILKGQMLPGIEGLSWLSHGPYLLKGFDEPLAVCEVGESAFASLQPPSDCEAGKRAAVAGAEPVLGWRPAVEQEIPGTRWVLEKQLGEGGFGEVWLARHRRSKDLRVFKFCFRADRLRALKREVTLFRVLKEVLGERPDIARLYDIQFEEAPYYLELEYTPGGDLAGWIDARGGFDAVPMASRLEIVAQIATALSAAHSVGVIHRDVKPTNVLVEERSDGSIQVCLTDFGIGELMDRKSLDRIGITVEGFTETISAIASASGYTGTRLYIAPELTAGANASTKTDLYSLGVLLYQLVVGDLTRPVATDWERHVENPLLRDDLHGCLAGDPADRFAGIEELARRLRTLPERRAERAKREAAERAHARRRRLALTMAASAALLVLLAIALGYGLLREQAAHRALEREFYYSTIRFAEQSIEQERFDQARDLLASCPPQYRQWEWGRLLYVCNRDLMTLKGHRDGILDVAFGPEGKRLATAGRDGTARIWDVETGREERTIQDTGDCVYAIAFSPDGKYLATTHSDHIARLWDAQTGNEIRTFRGHSRMVERLAFSPDGTSLVTGSRDKTAILWDIATGSSRTVARHAGCVHALALSPDGQRVATGSCDRTAKIWDLDEPNEEPLTLALPLSATYGIAFSPEGKYVVTAGWGHTTAKLWDVDTGNEIREFRGHTDWLQDVAFSPDGRILATASDDRTVKLWDVETGRELDTLKGHTAAVKAIAFSPDGRCLATASDDRTARLWEVETARALLEAQQPLAIEVGDSAKIGLHLVAVRVDRTAKRLNLLTQRDFPVLKQHVGLQNSLAFGMGGKFLSMVAKDGTVRLLDTKTGNRLLALRDEMDRMRSVALSPNRRHLIALSSRPGAALWDLRTARMIRTIGGNSEQIRAVAFSSDGKSLATAQSNTAALWEVETGNLKMTFRGHAHEVNCVAFSPNGRHLATGDRGHLAKIWDLETGREIRTFRDHTDLINAVAFSSDGSRLATASADDTAIIWDVNTRRKRATLKGHNGNVNAAAFSPDGERIVTASDDRLVKLWDAITGREVLTLAGHVGSVRSVAFSPDGAQLATGSADGTVVLWSSFAWDLDAYPGDTDTPIVDRIELYTREYWKKRMADFASTSPITDVRRIVDASAYSPGIPIQVKVDMAFTGETSSVAVIESFPEGWDIEDVSDGGTVHGNTIEWNLQSRVLPNVTLEYTTIPPPEVDYGPAVFANGVVKADPVWWRRLDESWLFPRGWLVFQEGVFPDSAYNGCQDAHVLVFRPDANTGSCACLEEGAGQGGGTKDHKKILIRFDLSSVPSTFSVGHATLRLYVFGERGAGMRNRHSVYVARILKQWGEGEGLDPGLGEAAQKGDVTFNNARYGLEPWEKRGATGVRDVADAETSATVGMNWPEWVSFDVTESVCGFLKNSSPNNGWKVSQDPDCGFDDSSISYVQGMYQCKSSEAPEVHLRPMLILIPSERTTTTTTDGP